MGEEGGGGGGGGGRRRGRRGGRGEGKGKEKGFVCMFTFNRKSEGRWGCFDLCLCYLMALVFVPWEGSWKEMASFIEDPLIP